MASHTCPKPQSHSREDIFSEQGRLKTFQNWPHSAAVEPAPLAKAGFYYLGQADQVRCAFCAGTLKSWQHGDDPLREHRVLFDNCPFIQGESVGNIPLEQASPREPCRELPHPPAACEQRKIPTRRDEPQPLPVQTRASRSGVVRLQPRHPDYQSIMSRQMSFVGWPSNLAQQPSVLVEAGFFYMGTEDGVCCFCCDGALRNWEPEDDPWVEHARWFPRCPYVLQQKGDSYINNVQAEFAALHQSRTGAGEEPSSEDPLMSSEVARQAMDMGFGRDRVLCALHIHAASSGGQLPPLDHLISTLLEEMPASQGERTASPVAPQAPGWLQPVSGSLTPSGEKPEEESSDRILCKVCMDREVAVTFLPCGHLVCCSECGKNVKLCPVCRQTVRASIRTYLC